MRFNHPSPDKAVMTVVDFCHAVGISRNRFYKELKLGRVHAKKSGSRTLVPATEVADWFERLPDAA